MTDPAKIEIDKDKVDYWLKQGASLSGSAKSILKKQGVL
jgi:ribosomal protein S16